LNRPKVNALNAAIAQDLRRVAEDLTDDPPGAVIITGGPKVFAAGADISEFGGPAEAKTIGHGLMLALNAIAAIPRVVIAEVSGYALGGGCELALACDLRIAGDTAKFGQPEVSLGIVPGAGATYRLPRLVGAGKARELVFTGRIVDAAEALRIGLVNQVVPDAEVHAAAKKMADDIVKQDRLAVRLAKMLFRLDGSFRPGAGYLGEALAQAVLFESEEKVRRMTEFLDRSKTKK
jgi:enoyl-CoA hydratase/carnithine racemase